MNWHASKQTLIKGFFAIATCMGIFLSFTPAAHAVVSIKYIDSYTSSGSIFYNAENPGNSYICGPDCGKGTDLWISQHRDRPLFIGTERGVYRVWDSDWHIKASLNGESERDLYEIWGHSGDVTAKINSDGDLYFHER